ncbi:AMP-binding protein [Microbacterium oxydans]|nr:AMP-binding protein [Microbacterium oxydans]
MLSSTATRSRSSRIGWPSGIACSSAQALWASGSRAPPSLRDEERAYAESAVADSDRASVRSLLDAAVVVEDADVPTLSGGAAPAVRRAHTVDVPVSAQTAADLGAVAGSDRRLTWADVHVAAFAAFAGRAAGVSRLVLGVPFAARATGVAARTPSMSVSVLPLPVRVDPADSLLAVALRVSSDLGVLRRAQRTRGEEISQERGMPSLLRGPGVNIKPYTPVLDFAAAVGTVSTVAAGPVDDVDLTIIPAADGGVRLRLEVNPDVYSPTEADRIAGRYAGFLARIAAEPTRPLGRAAALADGDSGASGSEPLPDGGYPLVDISEALARAVAADPEAVAIRAGDDAVTFAQLQARVRALAAVLVSRGIGTDDVVAIALPRGIDLVVTIFAVLEAGAAVAPVDLAYPDERIAFVLRHADPRLVVALDGSPAAAHPRALVLGEDGTAELPAARVDAVFPVPASGALASVTYTSGSTGTPKGVGVGRGSLAFFLAHHADTLFRPIAAHAGRRLRAAHTASFAFDSSWEQLLWLLLGHELVVFDEEDRRDAREIVEAVDRLQIDALDVTPDLRLRPRGLRSAGDRAHAGPPAHRRRGRIPPSCGGGWPTGPSMPTTSTAPPRPRSTPSAPSSRDRSRASVGRSPAPTHSCSTPRSTPFPSGSRASSRSQDRTSRAATSGCRDSPPPVSWLTPAEAVAASTSPAMSCASRRTGCSPPEVAATIR